MILKKLKNGNKMAIKTEDIVLLYPKIGRQRTPQALNILHSWTPSTCHLRIHSSPPKSETSDMPLLLDGGERCVDSTRPMIEQKLPRETPVFALAHQLH